MAATLATLTAALPQLSSKDRSFAEDLCRAWNRYGRLTEKQVYWADKLLERATAPAAPVAPRQTVEVGNFSGMIELFDRAAKSLKAPSVALHDETHGEIRLSLAGARSAHQGTINVATPGGYGNNIWFGRILKDGRFEISPRAQAGTSLIALLTRFAAEPAQTAADFGRMHGRCCFCNKGLDDAKSTAVGYGPTCAKKWGMPYGVEAARAASVLPRKRVRSAPIPFHSADLREVATA